MSEAGRKQYWKLIALAAICGAIVAGVWIGLIHSAAGEPTVPLTAPLGDSSNPEPRVWARSGVHVPPPTVNNVAEPTNPNLLIPQVPDVSSNTGLVIPVVTPLVPSMPPPPVATASAGPRSLDAGVISAGIPLPKIPEMPATVPIQITPIPVATLPTIQPIQAVSYDTLPVPAPPAAPAPDSPAPPAAAPVAPVPPASPAPVTVAPMASGAAAPSASVLPTTQPLQFPDVVQLVTPVLPVIPENPLPSANGGITVKPGGITSEPVPAAPVGLPQLPMPQAPMIPGTGTGTVLDRPKPIESALPATEKDSFSAPAAHALDTQKQPGDDTMIGTRDHIIILTTLASMFLAPAPALRADGDKAQEESLALKRFKEQADKNSEELRLINERLNGLQSDLRKLNETLSGKKDSSGYPVPSDPGILNDIKTLKDKLRDIDTALNQLKSQNSSLSPQKPVGSGTETLTPAIPKPRGKGIVRIVNEYPVPISMVINGSTSYKVDPTKARDIEVPAGDFTYQLLESGAQATKSTIRDNETVTLRIK